jgi:hypothetical protein
MPTNKNQAMPRIIADIYETVIGLYPERFRRRFGREMALVFQDMYRDERTRSGRIGWKFWFGIVYDGMRSLVREHGNELVAAGPKGYLREEWRLKAHNIIAAVCLLPFISLAAIDMLSRVTQGDFGHPNRIVMAALASSPVYHPPVPVIWALVLPVAALIISVVPLTVGVVTSAKPGSVVFLKIHALEIILGAVSLSCLAVLVLHDFAPCMVRQTINGGLFHLIPTVSYCWKA